MKKFHCRVYKNENYSFKLCKTHKCEIYSVKKEKQGSQQNRTHYINQQECLFNMQIPH